MNYQFGPENYMTVGDYHDYMVALDALARAAKISPALGHASRHEAKQMLRTLSARYQQELVNHA